MVSQRTGGQGRVEARKVVALLAPMLGWERSEELVGAAVRRLRLDESALDPEHVVSILEDLSLEEGIVGVTARFMLSRGQGSARGDLPPSSKPPAPSIAPPPDSSSAAVLATTIGVHEVVAQLTPLLGADKTEAAVQAGLRRLGLPRERLDREQAGRLLDDLGHQDGVVGMTVRFARGRVLGRFGG